MADSATATRQAESATGDARASLLVTLAGGLLQQGWSDDAERVARAAVALAPRDFAPRFALSEALAALGRGDEAVEQAWLAYAAARAGDPFDLVPLPELEQARARLAAANDAPPDAASLAPALGFAAAQRPKEAWLLARVGALYREAGAPGEAVVWYRRAAAIDTAHTGDLAAALEAAGAERALTLDEAADSPSLRDALRRVPIPGKGAVACRSLAGGAQNQMLGLEMAGKRFALRLEKFPSAGWHFYAEEAANAAGAHAAGVSPRLFYFDRADGTALLEFVDGPTMDHRRFADPAQAAAAGALYRKLHATQGFRGHYDILAMIEGDRAKRGGFCPDFLADLAALEAGSGRIRDLLQATRPPPVATHNDPIPQNFVAGAAGLMLLDWQCGALADPHWELGAFSAQAALPPPAEAAFFAAYFTPEDKIGLARARLMKPVCSFFWLGRALIRGATSPDEHWQEECRSNAAQLRRYFAEPLFEASVAVLQAAK